MTHQTDMSARAWAELLALALIWGASFLAIRLALDDLPVFWVVALRVAGAAAALAAYSALRGLRLPREPRTWLALLVMGVLNNVIPFTLITWGELRVPSGLASILNASTAIFGVLVAAVAFHDERLTARKLAGVALGFAGVATATGLHNLASLDPASLSQLALVGASVSYGVAATWARKRLRGLRPEISALGMLAGASLVMVPLALWHDGLPAAAPGLVALGSVAYLALVASAGAYLLYYRVLAMAGAGNLSLVTLLVAPFAILLGALVLGEVLHPRAYAGFALLALGLAVLDGRLLRRLRRA